MKRIPKLVRVDSPPQRFKSFVERSGAIALNAKQWERLAMWVCESSKSKVIGSFSDERLASFYNSMGHEGKLTGIHEVDAATIAEARDVARRIFK